ncbi:MAG: hypothetical protein WDN24_19500 [Sphingomonas sp.]
MRGGREPLDLDRHQIGDARVAQAGDLAPRRLRQRAHRADALGFDEARLEARQRHVARVERHCAERADRDERRHQHRELRQRSRRAEARERARHRAALGLDHRADDRHEQQQPGAVEHRPRRDQRGGAHAAPSGVMRDRREQQLPRAREPGDGCET